MSIARPILVACLALLLIPAAALAATFEGKVKGSKADEVSWLPFEDEIANFFVSDIVYDCETGEFVLGTGGFEKINVDKDGRFKDHEALTHKKVRYINDVKGRYNEDRTKAHGKVKFELKGKKGKGTNVCTTPWLRWTAKFKAD